jgi:methionyl-tRNA formyltransferase
VRKAEKMRVAFFGSGAFALPALEALLNGDDETVLVVSSPPAPAGRGRALTPTPVSQAGRAAGLPVLETASVNSPESLEAIERARPDLLCVAAFRGFLGKRLLETGWISPMNIHPSLLPRHRGPAPVNWTLMSGDETCGVSISLMDLKIDAGAVVAQKSRPVPEGKGAGELEAELAKEGAELLIDSIKALKANTLSPKPQNDEAATLNRLLAKSDGRLDFTRPPFETARKINGVDPWPGAQASHKGKLHKLFGAYVAEGYHGDPGQILGLDSHGRLMIGCGQGAVAVEFVQPEGKTKTPAQKFSHGLRFGAFAPSF